MAKVPKFAICFVVWLVTTLSGGFLGAQWAVKDVPQVQKLWAGDGIGIILYGGLGLFYGALLGLVVVLVF